MLASRVLGTALAACAIVPVANASQLGRLADGPKRLLVTFSDRPNSKVASARLAGLGAVATLVPEAGVWSIATRNAPTARDAALTRTKVRTAEWSLAHQSAETSTTVPTGPGPIVDPEPLNDPLFAPTYQWGLFETTWTPALAGSGPRPRIAILDGGVDPTHEEWSGTPSVLVDPYNSRDDRLVATDWGDGGHGTHVAGIAAAPANNGVGIVGVAPAANGSAEVIPVRIADREGASSDETMMKGIRWAVLHNAKVINISAGGAGYSQAFQNTVNWAFPKALIVASVGNDGDRGGNEINYPAAYDHVLGVGAYCHENTDTRDCPVAFGPATFSNHNRSLDIVAPGVDILSSVPARVAERRLQTGYAYKTGTSMAAPFVAGVATLVFAANPEARPEQVLRHLEATAKDLGKPGRDLQSGYGLVDPEAAVTLPLPVPDSTEPNDNPRAVARLANAVEARPPLDVAGRVDNFDDPHDLYPINVRRGQRVTITLTPDAGNVGIRLWKPGTTTVVQRRRGYSTRVLAARADKQATGPKTLTITSPKAGRYLVNVVSLRGRSSYTLKVSAP